MNQSELFIERLHKVVLKHPQRPAVVVAGETKLTYRELWNASGSIAIEFVRRGLGSEKVVAICVPKSAATIATIVGAWRCGAAWVPVEPTLPLKRINFLIEDSGSELIVCEHGSTEKLADKIPSLNIQTIADAKEHADESPFLNGRPNLSDLAYVIYTSGSTGEPKGVEVTHRGIVSLLQQQISAIRLTPESRSLFLLSTSFDASVSDIGTTLLSGASLWIEPDFHANGRLIATPEQILEVIKKRKITYVDIPPSVLAKLDPNLCPPSLTTILIGGEVCPPQVIRQWADKVRLLNVYGPTESTVCSSLSICDTHSCDRPLIGQPLAGVEYQINCGHAAEDQTNKNHTPKEDQGELLIGGKCLARGYRNRPELTASRFIERDGHTFYRTGDLVRRDSDGEFVFLGRIDRQIKLRGHRIEPGEIELVLETYPAVNRAAVIYDDNSKALVAFLATDRNDVSVSELRIFASSALPAYSVPQQFNFLTELPTTAAGKIDFVALGKLSKQTTHNVSTIEEASSEQERTLYEIFRRVLRHDKFSLDDHFFCIGGDSLGAMEVIATAHLNGISVSPQLLASCGSVKRICAELNCSGDNDFLLAEELVKDVDSILESRIANPQLGNSRRKPAQNNHILLTGATGFLGSRILECILDCESVQVTCLVRGNEDQVRERLVGVLAENKIDMDLEKLKRISVVSGDVSLPQLGLSAETYWRLASQVEQVIHSAANVNMIATYESLRPSNVVGVKNTADFVLSGQPKSLEYISTLSVFVGTDCFQGTMFERDNRSKTQRVFGGYAQSKWAAEILLQKLELNSRFYRLGLLTADTRSGVYPKHDLMTLAIKGIVEIGALPEYNNERFDTLRVDITPVNYAASVITAISKTQTDESTFHIAHPTGLSSTSLFKNLQQSYPHIKVVSVSEFERRVRDSKIKLPVATACLALCRALNSGETNSPNPLDIFQATETTFDMTNTKTCLAESELKPPDLTDEFVQHLVQQIGGSQQLMRPEMAVTNEK